MTPASHSGVPLNDRVFTVNRLEASIDTASRAPASPYHRLTGCAPKAIQAGTRFMKTTS